MRRPRRQAQRQVARVERRRSRRGLIRLVVAGLLLSGAAAGGSALYRLGDVPLASLELRGELNHVAPEAVVAVITEFFQRGLLRVDLHEVRQAVLRLPWVEDASVRRLWPDRLQISVREHVPVARWEGGGLVNARGVVFQPPIETYPTGLPLFEGPPGTAAILAARHREWSPQLAALGMRITELRCDARQSWRFRLARGIDVVLGRDADAVQLQRFLDNYGRIAAESTGVIEKVDLRYDSGIAVRWQAPSDERSGTERG